MVTGIITTSNKICKQSVQIEEVWNGQVILYDGYGINSRLDEVQAAILLLKLKK